MCVCVWFGRKKEKEVAWGVVWVLSAELGTFFVNFRLAMGKDKVY